VSVEYLDLIDYLAIAAEVTWPGATTIKLHVADSARRAPAAGFGDTVRGRPGTTDVREMTPVLGDLRRGDFDFEGTLTSPRRRGGC
jgi:hypothetical protein